MKKSAGKNKMLKLLQKKNVEEKLEAPKTVSAKPGKKRKQADDDDIDIGVGENDDLTRDERMAVELYRAIKRNKNDLDDEHNDDDPEEMDDGGEQEASSNAEVGAAVLHSDNVDL